MWNDGRYDDDVEHFSDPNNSTKQFPNIHNLEHNHAISLFLIGTRGFNFKHAVSPFCMK